MNKVIRFLYSDILKHSGKLFREGEDIFYTSKTTAKKNVYHSAVSDDYIKLIHKLVP